MERQGFTCFSELQFVDLIKESVKQHAKNVLDSCKNRVMRIELRMRLEIANLPLYSTIAVL